MTPQGDTRTRARDEFARLLTERGYLGVSLEEIATTVNIKKASLYHHFPGGKAALFTAVAHHYIQQTSTALRTALNSGDTLRDRLLALAGAYAQGTFDPALGDRVYDATRHVDDTTRTEICHAYLQALVAPVTDLMKHAIETGELRQADPGFLAMAFMELAAVAQPVPPDIALPPQERPAPTPRRQRAQDVVDLFLHGAAPDHPERRRTR
ncbi:TetR/AcrR family transcriptional regulator [Nonomuraea sp. PA05]|uniref:TetR/AcrR family transcriptional regulator n=1 Tax=Nonomuraea sp. PA05 TaxID=2604466 RepID=UPI0011DA9FF5|nr:TetR/AcrR family transcriptional regulator [Nonomuraea sp. PA05]TYB57617.1 TetR/AcrR family transcriptional regulator [Nonomuraea sp. PA05]